MTTQTQDLAQKILDNPNIKNVTTYGQALELANKLERDLQSFDPILSKNAAMTIKMWS